MNNPKLRIRTFLAGLEVGTELTARQVARRLGCTSSEVVAWLKVSPSWTMKERPNHGTVATWVKI